MAQTCRRSIKRAGDERGEQRGDHTVQPDADRGKCGCGVAKLSDMCRSDAAAGRSGREPDGMLVGDLQLP